MFFTLLLPKVIDGEAKVVDPEEPTYPSPVPVPDSAALRPERPPPVVPGVMLIPPMLTEVALEVPSEFWLLFWLVLPEVPIAACPLVLPWFWTALRTVVGLSAD